MQRVLQIISIFVPYLKIHLKITLKVYEGGMKKARQLMLPGIVEYAGQRFNNSERS